MINVLVKIHLLYFIYRRAIHSIQKPHKKWFEREIMRTKALEFIKQLIHGRNNIVVDDIVVNWKRTEKNWHISLTNWSLFLNWKNSVERLNTSC